jgi:hypothetical protein
VRGERLETASNESFELEQQLDRDALRERTRWPYRARHSRLREAARRLDVLSALIERSSGNG